MFSFSCTTVLCEEPARGTCRCMLGLFLYVLGLLLLEVWWYNSEVLVCPLMHFPACNSLYLSVQLCPESGFGIQEALWSATSASYSGIPLVCVTYTHLHYQPTTDTHTHTNTENQFTIIRSPRLTYISLLGPQSRCVWVCVCVCTRECNLFMLEPNVLGACLCLSLCANEPWRHPRWHLVCHVFQLDASILTVKYR